MQNSTKEVAVIQKVTLKHQEEPSAEDITLMAISIMDSWRPWKFWLKVQAPVKYEKNGLKVI